MGVSVSKYCWIVLLSAAALTTKIIIVGQKNVIATEERSNYTFQKFLHGERKRCELYNPRVGRWGSGLFDLQEESSDCTRKTFAHWILIYLGAVNMVLRELLREWTETESYAIFIRVMIVETYFCFD